jgi:RsiW-degrading membrane proteinase PrsW (M82 family)
VIPLGPAGETLPWLLFRAFVATALTEEGGKLAILLWWSRSEPDADARRWLAAGLAVGGGFAALEASANLIGGPLALLASLTLAVPSHLLDGVLLATRARIPGGAGRGLALVVLLHGLWDSGVFLLQAEPTATSEEDLSLRMLLGVALVVGVYLTQWVLGIRDGLAAYRGGRTPQDSGAGAGEGSV